jgi:hypothetical protein
MLSPLQQVQGSDSSSIDPVTGKSEALFNPRLDRWDEHFQFGAEIVGRTPTARVSLRLLQINRPDRVKERAVLIHAGLLRV